MAKKKTYQYLQSYCNITRKQLGRRQQYQTSSFLFVIRNQVHCIYVGNTQSSINNISIHIAQTGNSWGVDNGTGNACAGCGNQEQFYACSDVAIGHPIQTFEITKPKQSITDTSWRSGLGAILSNITVSDLETKWITGDIESLLLVEKESSNSNSIVPNQNTPYKLTDESSKHKSGYGSMHYFVGTERPFLTDIDTINFKQFKSDSKSKEIKEGKSNYNDNNINKVNIDGYIASEETLSTDHTDAPGKVTYGKISGLSVLRIEDYFNPPNDESNEPSMNSRKPYNTDKQTKKKVTISNEYIDNVSTGIGEDYSVSDIVVIKTSTPESDETSEHVETQTTPQAVIDPKQALAEAKSRKIKMNAINSVHDLMMQRLRKQFPNIYTTSTEKVVPTTIPTTTTMAPTIPTSTPAVPKSHYSLLYILYGFTPRPPPKKTLKPSQSMSLSTTQSIIETTDIPETVSSTPRREFVKENVLVENTLKIKQQETQLLDDKNSEIEHVSSNKVLKITAKVGTKNGDEYSKLLSQLIKDGKIDIRETCSKFYIAVDKNLVSETPQLYAVCAD